MDPIDVLQAPGQTDQSPLPPQGDNCPSPAMGRASLVQPPPEILDSIFLRSLPHPDLVDAQTCLSIKSTWHEVTRHKKNISLVCWRWYEIAVPYLYEDVCISRAHQLPLLYETLKYSQYAVRCHIQRLRISALVPDYFIWKFQSYLQEVLRLCPSLVSLDFIGCCGLPETTSPHYSPLYNLQIPDNVTHFTIHSGLVITNNDGPTHSVFRQTGNNLTHLYLVDFVPYYSATFPVLLDLTIEVPSSESSDKNLHACHFYTFPAIQRLTFVFSSWYHVHCRIAMFVSTHGSGLRMLQLQELLGLRSGDRYMGGNNSIYLQPILDFCPRLEHLVLHPDVASVPIQHPQVQWVDIWEPSFAPSESEPHIQPFWDLKDSITTINFPRLKGVRTLAITLLSLYPSIPITFPPSSSQIAPCTFEFSNSLYVQYDKGRIYSPPHETFVEEDDDSDGTYEPSSDEEAPDSVDGNHIDEINCDLLLERFGNLEVTPTEVHEQDSFSDNSESSSTFDS